MGTERKGRSRRGLIRWSCASLASLFLGGSALALDPTKDLLQYNCQSWSRQSGLPVNGIRSIEQSTDDYIWLGTTAGLLRFDGTEFQLIDFAAVAGIRSSIVTSLASSQAGGLWVGFENGSFGRYDGATLKLWDGPTDPVYPFNVRSLHEDSDGTLWMAAQREVARITPDHHYEPVLSFSDTLRLNILFEFADSRHRHWISTAQDGVHVWEDGKLQRVPQFDGITAQAMTEDGEGNLWFATSIGMQALDAALKTKTVPQLPDVRTMLVDRHGTLWFGTIASGLARYQAGEFQFLRKLDGLASDFITTLKEDKEGNLWVGTRDGLTLLSDIKFPPLQTTSVPSPVDFASAVSPSHNGGAWVAGAFGLSYVAPDGRAGRLIANASPKGPAKRVFEASNGDVYLVSSTTTLVIVSEEKVAATYEASTLVVGLAEDATGVVASLGNRLFRASKDALTPYVFTEGEPDFRWIVNLANARDGGIWVASENGLFWVKDGKFKQWTGAHGLKELGVQTVMEDVDGSVWMSGFASVSRMKDGKISVITRKDGLFDDNVYAIVPDDIGGIWFDAGLGIFRVSRRQLEDFMDGRITRVQSDRFDGPDSVKTTDKSTPQERVGCKSIDGRIWFPSANGVVVIDPSHIPMNRNPPAVHIDRVIANGAEVDPDQVTRVPPGKGELEFRFTALSFLAPHRVKFRYQLEGYDREWVETGNRRAAFYTNLPPGSYTFRVLAANGDGVWNNTGDSVQLELRPHFRQTTWFYALCGSVAVGLIAGAYLTRVRLLQQKQRALQTARDQLEIQVAHRTSQLASANDSLHGEVEEHRKTEAELQQKKQSLEAEIEERKRMQLEIERVHRELVQISRQAGMAEVATSVLHNVGNVLNSVNVSATLLMDQMRGSKVSFVPKIGAMLQAKASDLAEFLSNDPKGRKLPDYLGTLGNELMTEQQSTIEELGHLRKNIEHIKEIVAMQQNFATAVGVEETIPLTEIVEDAIRINSSALTRHEVELVRDYQVTPVVTLERHKVLQVLVNLIRNAKYACDEAKRTDKQVVIRLTADESTIRMAVIDNGIGIPPENLTRIFSHGFTTKKEGHGFGLHSGALAAKELGGALVVKSDGVGRGATFILEIPKHVHPAGIDQGPVVTG